MRLFRTSLPVFFLLFIVLSQPLHAYRILYAEQFYKLFHQHLYSYPENCAENIYYLEQALRADFANPLNALAKIRDQRHWERYRYLFYMHVSLKLIEQYLLWGSKYDKMIAYFYNAPWQRQNLESLEKAESLYRYALVYWDKALEWSKKAYPLPYHMEEIQRWEDENERIENGSLNYRSIIAKHLTRLEGVRKDFLAMDASTY